MVYEGKRRRKTGRKKGGGGGRRAFFGLLWCLILVVAASLAFPKTARRVRDKAADALGVDIGGAMEVFSREAKEKNVFSATKEAFKFAFAPTDGGDVETLAKEDKTPPKGEDGGAEPKQEDSTPPEDTASFEDLPLPEHVVLEKPRENLVLAGPLAGEVCRGFGYTPDESGEPVFHYGIDVRGESGSSVRCVADGTVAAVGESVVFGKYVIVTHEDGVESLYAMLGDTPLSEGQTVGVGQSVGTLSGDTLHMELLVNGDYVNPQHYVYRNDETA